ncbi:two-component system LytT family response regulator [Dyadobacter sp. BE34]|uniref:Two-component system LytT family response regulator n=1 Tax=Dyadobacter fermentans TaxID=94254 RepID=A0ABU1QXV5_9BACT|nr:MULTISPECIES: LytTR family transcriptional regulator DNA-binding domain-containing protein [Dyadobacter]MDR6805981.1 two-component system LytT family response regulator [Dyadobacter fermentans]MDR7043721.1 two-component system LytT family response regulator [Dyadobacter sp. BE242]MDR7198033.1 two-component system LytT family response regulator [Dyadobacter sp. BE34]MDR7215995.1 two-component system LytT family response regulator [Dyadobacter sp. BE31]MDR7264479.1 two-component system LytT f
MIRAIIIDDEPNAVGLISLRLAQHCPQVEVIACCTSSQKGVQAILDHQTDLDVVFLDIEMPQMNGFQVLEAVGNVSFSLVFVTAYDQFALKAFRYSAVDYLLKPIDTQELIQAVTRIENQRKTTKQQLEHLKDQFNNPARTFPDRIALSYQNGIAFVLLKDIIYCESDDNYTKVYVQDGQHYLSTRSMRDIQGLLEERDFLRVHRKFLINLLHIKKFVKGEGSYLVMSNQQTIPVSRLQKDRLMEHFDWL